MENTNITHKNPMHLNVKHRQWEYPINVICGFEMGNCVFPISTSIHGFLQNFPVSKGVTLKKPRRQGYSEQINMLFGAVAHIWLTLG